jgi:hypothetical protein
MFTAKAMVGTARRVDNQRMAVVSAGRWRRAWTIDWLAAQAVDGMEQPLVGP